MHLLIVDNYDSFTYNLVHYFEELDCFVDVVKNDELDFKTISKYDAIVLSPGPGLPEDSGKLMEVISEFYLLKPILGVCLGMQAIGTFFGGKLVNQKKSEAWETGIGLDYSSFAYIKFDRKSF